MNSSGKAPFMTLWWKLIYNQEKKKLLASDTMHKMKWNNIVYLSSFFFSEILNHKTYGLLQIQIFHLSMKIGDFGEK